MRLSLRTLDPLFCQIPASPVVVRIYALRYLAEVGSPLYNSMYVDTDTQGRFRFRITRYIPRKPVVAPDTFSLYVRAAVRPNPGSGAPSSVADSVLVQVELVPVGAVPRPAEVEIRLPHP